MRWQAILIGVVASGPIVARADCDAIEMVTTGEFAEVSCHTSPEPSLPWVDCCGPRPDAIPPRFAASVVSVDTSVVGPFWAMDISDITRFDPWYDIPEVDQ